MPDLKFWGRFAIAATVLFSSISFTSVSSAELYEARSAKGDYKLWYWRPSDGQRKHPGNLLYIDWDIDEPTVFTRVLLEPGESYSLKGTVRWSNRGCGNKANPCIRDEKDRFVPNVKLDLYWAPTDPDLQLSRSSDFFIKSVETDADGKFEALTKLPKNGDRYDSRVPSFYSPFARNVEHLGQKYQHSTNGTSGEYLINMQQQIYVDFALDDFRVTAFNPEVINFEDRATIPFSGRIKMTDYFAEGRRVEDTTVSLKSFDTTIAEVPVDSNGNFSGQVKAPALMGAYPVNVTAHIDGQSSLSRSSRFLGETSELATEVGSFLNGYDDLMFSFDVRRAVERKKNSDSSSNDIFSLHCEMIGQIKSELSFLRGIEGPNFRDERYQSIMANYREKIFSQANSPQDAVTLLYGGMTTNKRKQICEFENTAKEREERNAYFSSEHFLAPLIKAQASELYMVFLDETLAEVGFDMFEAMPFGKMDFSGIWTEPESNEKMTIADYGTFTSNKEDTFLELILWAEDSMEPVLSAHDGPVSEIEDDVDQSSFFSTEDQRQMKSLYSELMKSRYFGARTISQIRLKEIFDQEDFDAEKQAKVKEAFEALYALNLSIAASGRDFHFSFKHAD